tara:strand:- start:1258 stop:1746 length:489 start_codon:yes stop_codon:yes gene_type:complete
MSNTNKEETQWSNNDYSVANRQRSFSHNWLIFRPKTIPEGWGVIEQNDSYSSSYTSFVKWCKIHHNAEPQRLWIVFNQFNPLGLGLKPKFLYSVNAGRHIKPGEGHKGFNDMKDVETYIIYLMEKTDKWISEINTEQYIKEYNERIAKLVEADDKRNRKKNI